MIKTSLQMDHVGHRLYTAVISARRPIPRRSGDDYSIRAFDRLCSRHAASYLVAENRPIVDNWWKAKPAMAIYRKKGPLYAPQEVHPQAVLYRFRRIKWTLLVVGLVVYYLLPFVRWDRGLGALTRRYCSTCRIAAYFFYRYGRRRSTTSPAS